MTSTNREIVKKFYEYFNTQQIEHITEITSKDAVFHGLDYVGMGILTDSESGNQVFVKRVYEGGPSAGKLEPGDELIRVKQTGRIVESYAELKDFSWGRGKLGDPIELTIKRNGSLFDISIPRGRVPGPDFPLNEAYKDMAKYVDNFHYDIRTTVAEGDQVVAFVTGTLRDKETDITVLFSEFTIFRLEDGKIVEMWSIDDNINQMMQLGYQLQPPVKAKA